MAAKAAIQPPRVRAAYESLPHLDGPLPAFAGTSVAGHDILAWGTIVNYLIDTNIISEVRKGARSDANVARWYEGIEDNSLYLSVLVLGEIRKGVEKIHLRDSSQARALEKWLTAVGKAFGERVLPVDSAVADEWGRMSASRPLPVIDGLLAATAKIHGMTLVTRNARNVAGLDVRILNPFHPGQVNG